MKPLDPRLVRTTRAVRVHLSVTVACGLALTGLILLQAWLVARAVARAPVLDDSGSWTDVGGVVALVGVLGYNYLQERSHGREPCVDICWKCSSLSLRRQTAPARVRVHPYENDYWLADQLMVIR